MTGEHAEDIGRLKADSKRALSSIDGLYESNEKRKAETVELKFQIQSIQHTVEETNVTANKVARFMEDLKESVDSVKEHVISIDERVLALEAQKFDFVKVFKWLATARGFVFMVILIGVFNPASQDFLIELANSILGKAK